MVCRTHDKPIVYLGTQYNAVMCLGVCDAGQASLREKLRLIRKNGSSPITNQTLLASTGGRLGNALPPWRSAHTRAALAP